MIIRQILQIAAAMATINIPIFAQQPEDPTPEMIQRIKSQSQNIYFGINFSFTRPQSDFRRTLDSIGKSGPILGFAIEGGYHFDPIPLAVGMNVDVLFNGHDEKRFRSYNNMYGFYAYDTLSATNNLVPINFFLRFQPNILRYMEPYAEVIGGATILSASNELRRTWYPEQSNTKVSLAWNYGFGFGLNIRLVDYITLPNEIRSTFLSFNARYILGTSVKYSVASYDTAQQQVQMTDISSATDLFFFHAGLTFRF